VGEFGGCGGVGRRFVEDGDVERGGELGGPGSRVREEPETEAGIVEVPGGRVFCFCGPVPVPARPGRGVGAVMTPRIVCTRRIGLCRDDEKNALESRCRAMVVSLSTWNRSQGEDRCVACVRKGTAGPGFRAPGLPGAWGRSRACVAGCARWWRAPIPVDGGRPRGSPWITGRYFSPGWVLPVARAGGPGRRSVGGGMGAGSARAESSRLSVGGRISCWCLPQRRNRVRVPRGQRGAEGVGRSRVQARRSAHGRSGFIRGARGGRRRARPSWWHTRGSQCCFVGRRIEVPCTGSQPRRSGEENTRSIATAPSRSCRGVLDP